MDFRSEVRKILDAQEKLLRAVVESFEKEIADPGADQSGSGPDGPMIGAEAIGIQLFIDGQYQLAAALYRLLAKETVAWRESANQQRHAGVFYANLGAALALLGDIDRACIALWTAAREDEITSGTSPDNTFALQEMFDSYFGKPAREFAFDCAHSVNPAVTQNQIVDVSKSLGSSRYAFLAYLHVGRIHEEESGGLESDFSYFQKLNIIRTLSVLLETLIRKICGTSKETILKSLEQNPDKSKIPWLKDFKQRVEIVGANRKSTTVVDDQLKGALATPIATDDERFWVSLLVGYIVRNYSAHQMDVSPQFLRSDFKTVVGHIVHAMIYAPRYR